MTEPPGASAKGPLAGERFGAYELSHRLQSGGTGDVYLAKRVGEFEQQVAVKVLTAGIHSPNAARRFAEERRTLSRLEHRSIARLLDGGVSDANHPYLVVEYVDGQPIDAYCRANALPLRDRLKLFLQVCDAVAYAQRNLIVHCDIKPSNVLVTDDARVKLLDFGIARTIGETVSMTQADDMAMTPRYATPEQIAGESVTMATDVYALGVMLYELLCGAHPFAAEGVSAHALRRAILEDAPVPPSRHITTRADRWNDDLDTICLMALRRDPLRRYGSAEELAADTRRYVAGRTVSAKIDTVGYRVRRFASRNARALVATAAVITAIAVLTIAYSGRLASERDVARAEEAKAESVADFLISVFSVADPNESAGDTVTARELLDRGAARIRDELEDQPAVQAEMMQVVGRVYHSLGMFAEAETLVTDALAIRQRLYSRPNREIIESMGLLMHIEFEKGDPAKTYQQVASLLELQLEVLGEADTLVALSYNNLGWLAYELENLDEAEEWLLKALELRVQLRGSHHYDVGETLNNLGVVAAAKGDFDRGEQYYKEALENRIAALGEQHSKVSDTLNNLAVVYEQRGELAEAEQTYRRAFVIKRDQLGPDHPDLSTLHVNLGRLLRRLERFDEAQREIRRAIALDSQVSPTHPWVAYDINELGVVIMESGQPDEAVRTHQRALEIYLLTLGRDHGYVVSCLASLGVAYLEAGKADSASAMLNEAVTVMRATDAEDNPRRLLTEAALIAANDTLENRAGASPELEAAYGRLVEAIGADDARARRVASWLAREATGAEKGGANGP